MVGHVTRTCAFAAAVAITAACASTAGLRSAPLDAGETKFYAAPLAVVGPAAGQAVLAAGLNVDTVSPPDSLTWMIIAKKGMSLFSYGELVRVVVAQTPDRAVAVRVYTKRRLATNVTAKGDWSGPIFQQLDRSEEHTSELQSQSNLVCRLLLEKKKIIHTPAATAENYHNRQ